MNMQKKAEKTVAVILVTDVIKELFVFMDIGTMDWFIVIRIVVFQLRNMQDM